MIQLARAFSIQSIAFFAAAAFLTARGYCKRTDKYTPEVKSHLVFSGLCFVLMLVFLLLSYLV